MGAFQHCHACLFAYGWHSYSYNVCVSPHWGTWHYLCHSLLQILLLHVWIGKTCTWQQSYVRKHTRWFVNYLQNVLLQNKIYHDDVAGDSLSFFILGNTNLPIRLLQLNFYTVVSSTKMLYISMSRVSAVRHKHNQCNAVCRLNYLARHAQIHSDAWPILLPSNLLQCPLAKWVGCIWYRVNAWIQINVCIEKKELLEQSAC